jgi:FAD binding domain
MPVRPTGNSWPALWIPSRKGVESAQEQENTVTFTWTAGCLETVETLRSRLACEVILPSDAELTKGETPWSRTAPTPWAIVRATCTQDVLAAVRVANELGEAVAVWSGPGATVVPAEGAIVIDTSLMDAVTIDPHQGTARVMAGTRWRRVLDRAARFGLTGPPDAAVRCGVVDHLLSGDICWLSRSLGAAGGTLLEATVVTGDGRVVRVGDDSHPELLWALRSGCTGLGIVTSATIRLRRVGRVYAGALLFRPDRARLLLDIWRRWTSRLTEATSSMLQFIRLAGQPTPAAFPEGRFLRVLVCHRDAEGGDGQAGLLDPLRRLGPLTDTVAGRRDDAFGAMVLGPAAPLADGYLVNDFTPELVAGLARTVAAGSGSTLPAVSLLHLGGRPGRYDPAGSTGRLRAPYLLHGIPPATAAELGPALARVAFHPETCRRMAALKGLYDPNNLLRYQHTVPIAPAAPAEGDPCTIPPMI